MMKLLIAQFLLCDLTWELKFLEQKDLDLDSLCKLLRGLLQQLLSVAFFFLVIDGIILYERANRRPDFLEAMTELLNIMDDCKNVTMKLLLTYHGHSAFVKDLINDDDTLVFPSTVDGDCQGWSEYGWDRSVGDDVETLEKTVS